MISRRWRMRRSVAGVFFERSGMKCGPPVASGQEVALEVLWVGVLAVDVGSLAIGDEMRANFGVFLTFRDGLIVRQRNYDCFEPF